MSLGAGVDHVLAPGQVPPGVPILRVADPQMAERMATYVVWGVASWQRRFEEYYAAQRARRWDLTIEGAANRDNRDVRVGVLGHGLMGRAAAQALVGLGYQVASWSRSAKPARDGAIECYHGRGALRDFAARSDVLVCLLPLTDETRGIVNAELLSWMPRGGALINGARGGHVVEEDLLAALDGGQLTFALLDVFATEPLPEDSPLWLHPRVRITPHVASMTTLEVRVVVVAVRLWWWRPLPLAQFFAVLLLNECSPSHTRLHHTLLTLNVQKPKPLNNTHQTGGVRPGGRQLPQHHGRARPAAGQHGRHERRLLTHKHTPD
jgi:glyoxylate/hydroxypyruvate reductase A